MPFDGSGNYTPPTAPVFPAVSGTTINSAYFNSTVNDLASGLSTTFCRDGQAPATGNFNLNTHRIVGLGDPLAAADAVTKSYQETALADLSANLAAVGGAALVGAEDASSGTLWTTVQGFINKLLSSAGASVVGVTQSGTGTKSRVVQDELRETVKITQFTDCDPTGATSSTAAFQTVLNRPAAGVVLECIVPDGTYNLATSPTAGVGRVKWVFGRNVTLTGSGVLPWLPAKVQYSGVPISGPRPNQVIIEGSPTAPLTDLIYSTPSLYVERHTNGANAASCDWGNSKKTSPILVEVVAYGAETGEVNTIAGRVFSNTTAPSGAQGLVSASFLAQSNAPAGTANRDVWGANIIAASSTGNAASNLVGIEVDIIPSAALPAIRPGQPSAINATAYWAQAASLTANSNTAFLATSASPTQGWLYGMVVDCPIYDYAAYLRTSLNAPSSKGLRVETQYAASSGTVAHFFAGSNEQFRVDGDSNNPCWIRVGGVLKNVTQNATVDSAGTGYRSLRVIN